MADGDYSSIANCRAKLQDYLEGYSGFYLKIVVCLFNDFSRNPSRYSAYLWLSGTATCAQTFNVLCNVQLTQSSCQYWS